MPVRSFNGYVPYLFLASFLATWFRIRVIVLITLILMLILIALSGYSMQYDGAGYGRVGRLLWCIVILWNWYNYSIWFCRSILQGLVQPCLWRVANDISATFLVHVCSNKYHDRKNNIIINSSLLSIPNNKFSVQIDSSMCRVSDFDRAVFSLNRIIFRSDYTAIILVTFLFMFCFGCKSINNRVYILSW